MADSNKKSIEEMLKAAAAKRGAGDESPASDAPAEEPAAEAAESTPAEKPAAKPSGKMSIQDMLAASKGGQSGGGAEKKAPAKPAAKSGGSSIQDMLAAGKAGGSAEKKAPAKSGGSSLQEMLAKGKSKPAADTKKPAAKKTAKASPKQPAAKKDDGPVDTASILAGARKSPKRGPVSKSEAEAKGVTAPKRKRAPKLQAPPMPEKPAYAKPRPAASSDTDRRGFMATLTAFTVGSPLAIGFTTVALTNLMWVLGLARFMFPNILTEPPTSFKVGFPGDLAPGQVEAKYKAQFGVWIVRGDYQGESQIYALKSVCTHLGCTPNWLEGEQKFKCPCHGSGFYKDGINFEGPAPRPLERYAIKLADDGQLEVDKSATFLEEKGDWKDPACKVLV